MNEFELNGFLYKIDDRNSYKVESNIEDPKRLFKYYYNNDNSIDALKKKYLFCSHPYHLNDGMDCSSNLYDFSNLSESNFNTFILTQPSLKGLQFEQEKRIGFRNLKQVFFDSVNMGTGIISLSSTPLNTLMWSHYSSEKGFMVEFDTDILKKSIHPENRNIKNYTLFPINYLEQLNKIDFFDKNFTSPDIPFLITSSIKRKDWSYENEWRLLTFCENYGIPRSLLLPYKDVEGNPRKVNYKKETIKSITLGKQFFNGRNITELIGETGTIYRLKKDVELVNYLYENYNECLFLCGEYIDKGIKLRRTAERITLKKHKEDVFEIVPTNEEFFDLNQSPNM